MEIFEAVGALVAYAQKEHLIEKEDAIYTRNQLLEKLSLDDYKECELKEDYALEDILAAILEYAVANGLCEDTVTSKDLFDTKIMGTLIPKPSEVQKKFWAFYKENPEKATDYYYNLSRKSDYIREYRVKNDLKWTVDTDYGKIDITVNLSKPEKSPKDIAAARSMPQNAYPQCQLCKENEGYAGRLNHPARQNHRIIPITVNNSQWFMQYSPYVYYNEHCIVFNGAHTPMKIDGAAFHKLFDFIKLFPHYFVGSNADLPIVGGSILTHEHFQGGRYVFPMERAEVETEFHFDGFDDVKAGIVKWPMSVVRLRSENTERICELADRILVAWRKYTDADAYIFAETDGVPHNTITPIARFRDGAFELDLVLRNNITTEEFPDGLYHPHPEYHHIKRENIGLIEVMGLAVLPARLNREMATLRKAILNGEDISANEEIAKHAEWAQMIKDKYTITEENCEDILKKEIGIVFAAILEQSGVYKRDEEGKKHFLAFLKHVNENA